MRGVSTVVDVTLFLLLVSVALVALTIPGTPGPNDQASDTANALSRTTANATFQLAPLDGDSTGPPRRVSGTHAGLLGRAALANLQVDGHPLAPESGAFVAAVRNETRESIALNTQRTAVTVTWQPYEGAPVAGRVQVGARPPEGVEVATATLHVTTPVDACRHVNQSAADEGFEGVGRAVSSCLIDTTLPPTGISTPDPSSAAGLTSRNRLAAYETALALPSTNDSIADRRTRIRSTLADQLSADMRKRFETSAGAAAAVRTGTSRIVVRMWDP